MTITIDARNLIALGNTLAGIQKLGFRGPADLHQRLAEEARYVENQIQNCRAFAATYRLDPAAEPYLDPSVVHV
jgi:hypothetical protein